MPLASNHARSAAASRLVVRRARARARRFADVDDERADVRLAERRVERHHRSGRPAVTNARGEAGVVAAVRPGVVDAGSAPGRPRAVGPWQLAQYARVGLLPRRGLPVATARRPAARQTTTSGGAERHSVANRGGTVMGSIGRAQTVAGSGWTQGVRYGRRSSLLASSSPTTTPFAWSHGQRAAELHRQVRQDAGRRRDVALLDVRDRLLARRDARRAGPSCGRGSPARRASRGPSRSCPRDTARARTSRPRESAAALPVRDEVVAHHAGLERALVAVERRAPRILRIGRIAPGAMRPDHLQVAEVEGRASACR